MSRARVKCHVFVDFDGTIAPCDATDMLFEQFADPSWRDVEEEWQAGLIGSRECMTRQVSLLRATPQELVAAASRVGVDRGFPMFVRECVRNGFGMTVVSDGFDIVIDSVLRSAGLSVPFYANHLEPVGERPLARDVPVRAQRLPGLGRELQVFVYRTAFFLREGRHR